MPADAEDGEEVKPMHRKLSKAQLEKQLTQQGVDRAKAAGICYSREFQKMHHSRKDHIPPGHWSRFALQVAKAERIKCESCRRLRDRIVAFEAAPAAEEADAVIQDAAADVVAASPERPQVSTGKGRPKKGQQAAQLCDWIETQRPGTYRHLVANVWVCELCKMEINCFRAAESGRRYILRHEDLPVHKRNSTGADPERRDCPGIPLGQGQSSIDKLEDSCVRWVKKGMIQTKAAAQDDTRSCVVTWDGEVLILKHKQCCKTARSGGLACIRCQRLADSKAFQKEVAVWSLRIQYAAYMHTLVYGTDEEQLRLEEELLVDEAGQFCPGEVAAVLAIKTKAGRVSYLKRLLQAVNLVQRTERLHEFVQAAVVGLHFHDDSNDERQAFQALVSGFATKVLDGSVSRDTLQLASKVASGALSGHKVVNCLLQSFVLKEEKLSRGLSRVNRSIDSDTLQEVYCTLGRSKETSNLLGLFGITDRKSKIDLLMPGVPQCWLAHAEPELLAANCRTILENLSITSAKPRAYFLAVDETCWHRCYLPIVGLRQPGQCSVVGGQWSKVASENFAVLKAGDKFPPDRLSSLTVHVVASRVESNSSLWCVAEVPMPSGSSGKAHFFLELMGELAESFTAENQGQAPAAFACDAGTSNMLLVRASLGMTPKAATETTAFFRHCSWAPCGFRYMPFKKMLCKGTQVVHCTLDTLHLLKRLAFHTGSRAGGRHNT